MALLYIIMHSLLLKPTNQNNETDFKTSKQTSKQND